MVNTEHTKNNDLGFKDHVWGTGQQAEELPAKCGYSFLEIVPFSSMFLCRRFKGNEHYLFNVILDPNTILNIY